MPTVDELLLRVRTVGAGTAATEIRGVETGLGRVGSTAKTVAGAVGIAGVAIGLKDITEAAVNFQAQQKLLQNALNQTGQGSKDNVERITNAADTLSTHGGFDPTTSLAGMARLVRAHDSVAQAIKDETLVTDLARGSGLAYQTALRAVMIVEQGRTTGLARLGVVIQPVKTAEDALTTSHRILTAATMNQVEADQAMIDKIRTAAKAHGGLNSAQKQTITGLQSQIKQLENTGQHVGKVTDAMRQQAKQEDANATKASAMATLWQRYGGATKAYSDSAAGAASNFKNAIEVLAQRLGSLLPPAIKLVLGGLTGVAKVIAGVIGWFIKGGPVAHSMAIAIGLVAAAWTAYTVATALAAAATAILDAALMAAGIGEVILLVTGLVLLITHFGTVVKAVAGAFTTAWHWIEGAAKDVFNWIKAHWPLLAGILLAPMTGGISLIVALFHKQLWGAIQAVFGWIKGAATDVRNWVVGRFDDIVNFVKSLPGKIANIASGLWDGLKTGLTDVVNWIEDRLKGIVSALINAYNAIPLLPNISNPFSTPNYVLHPNISGPQWPGQHNSPIIAKQPTARRATGGPANVSGWYDVGERGRERVFLPAGAYVQPNDALEGGGGDRVIHNEISISVGPYEFAKAMGYSLGKAKAVS